MGSGIRPMSKLSRQQNRKKPDIACGCVIRMAVDDPKLDLENISSDSMELDDELWDVLTGQTSEYTEQELYDDTPMDGDIYGVRVNPDLPTELEPLVNVLAPLSRGLIVVTGFPGSGKGLFMVWLAWMMRFMFGKKIGSDFRPRKYFDEVVYPANNRYFPFNETVMRGDFDRMKQVAKGRGLTVNKESDLGNLWVAREGAVKLQNAILLLDELWRYFHRRRPHGKMNFAVGGLIKVFRHLDLCIIGAAPNANELDVKTCLQYQTHEVSCDWLTTKRNTTRATIKRIRCVESNGMRQSVGKPFFIDVDGKKPREYLNGRCFYDLYVSKNVQSIG